MSSGYRDFKEQRKLYEEMGSDYALPAGYSEHNLGLSLDVGSTQMKMEKAPEGKWIEENVWKYGFFYAIRKIKVILQGFNMSHGIYVMSVYHIVLLCTKNFTLEEYLDFLQEKKKFQRMLKVKIYDFLL